MSIGKFPKEKIQAIQNREKTYLKINFAHIHVTRLTKITIEISLSLREIFSAINIIANNKIKQHLQSLSHDPVETDLSSVINPIDLDLCHFCIE